MGTCESLLFTRVEYDCQHPKAAVAESNLTTVEISS